MLVGVMATTAVALITARPIGFWMYFGCFKVTTTKIIYRFHHDRLNLTNVDEPFFAIDSLESFTSFDTFGDDSLKAIVYAVNQKGRSQGSLVKEFAFESSIENRAGNYTNVM